MRKTNKTLNNENKRHRELVKIKAKAHVKAVRLKLLSELKDNDIKVFPSRSF